MLSYQHGYHAGNFADVVKHFTLTRILQYLTLKEKPFFYLETHAGKGRYDLRSQEALKTAEFRQGIDALWPHQALLSDLFDPYLQAIRSENPTGELEIYPGSPLLAMHQSRRQDRVFAAELHPAEFQALTALKTSVPGASIQLSQSDGLAQLNALLPPPERRGLVFIDPSYEIKTDYQLIPNKLQGALARFSTGIYCIWYPILSARWHAQMISTFSEMATKHLRVEFCLTDLANQGMVGSGLWIINPPYVLAQELGIALPQLVTFMAQGRASFLIE